jgi:hypothetical protein
MQNSRNIGAPSITPRTWGRSHVLLMISQRFGSAQIVLRQARTVQVEGTEEFRLEAITGTSELSELPTG